MFKHQVMGGDNETVFPFLSFLGNAVPVHWVSSPPQTSHFICFSPPIFSCQNLAWIALFESEYGSTGPNTKLELLHCVSSYVWPLHQHRFLSLSILRLDSVRTWSVLVMFLLFLSTVTDTLTCQLLSFKHEAVSAIFFVDLSLQG